MDEISIFLDLPRDLQCLILRQPISKSFLQLIRGISKKYYAITTECVTSLQPSSDEIETYVEVELVLQLHNLVSCQYLIIIRKPEQLLSLAHHPSLKFAIFDVNRLTELRYTDNYISLYKELYILNDSFWFLSFFLQQTDQRANGCPSNPSYDYTFTYRTGYKFYNKVILRIYEGGLEINTQLDDQQLVHILELVDRRYDLCYYVGPLPEDDRVLLNSPSLIHIATGWEDIVPIRSHLSLILANITIYIPNTSEIWRKDVIQTYIPSMTKFLRENKDYIYPGVTTFLPVTPGYLKIVEKIFPNLDDITLIIYDLNISKIDWSLLSKYSTITLYLGSRIPVFIPPAYYNRVRIDRCCD